MAQAIAERLRLDPGLIALARDNLQRWSQTCSPRAQSTLQEWAEILDKPIEQVIAVLTGRDERATRLRQSNPFAGALPQKVRNEILLRFEARDKAAT
jgi:hypothetical protein